MKQLEHFHGISNDPAGGGRAVEWSGYSSASALEADNLRVNRTISRHSQWPLSNSSRSLWKCSSKDGERFYTRLCLVMCFWDESGEVIHMDGWRWVRLCAAILLHPVQCVQMGSGRSAALCALCNGKSSYCVDTKRTLCLYCRCNLTQPN